MNVKDFYFDLPEEQIAQDPLSDRSSSKLLVLDKVTGKYKHEIFKNVIDYLEPDCLENGKAPRQRLRYYY